MLVVVATPIGNLGDITPRAAECLRAADAIACEDTRRTRILLDHLGIPRPALFISYREGNEERVGNGLIKLLREGKTVALCSDGGYPGISDPGYRIVSQAAELGLPIDVMPGASAVPVALILSGLPTSSYTFKGYPPRKPGARHRFFADEKDRPHTLIVFESPLRVGLALQAAFEALGNRRAAVCSELTKAFQRVERGFLADLCAAHAEGHMKGEVTLVIAGNNPKMCRENDVATDLVSDVGI